MTHLYVLGVVWYPPWTPDLLFNFYALLFPCQLVCLARVKGVRKKAGFQPLATFEAKKVKRCMWPKVNYCCTDTLIIHQFSCSAAMLYYMIMYKFHYLATDEMVGMFNLYTF